MIKKHVKSELPTMETDINKSNIKHNPIKKISRVDLQKKYNMIDHSDSKQI
jgi:hypothetical protein